MAYTAAQAQDVFIGDLVEALLRAQFMAIKWARADVRSRKEIRIAFPDNRIINYFTFLPGSRHVLIYDMHNVISCWTVKGIPLNFFRVERGAKLTRWKPLEESEIDSEYGDRAWEVEIMLEYTE